VKEELKPCPFCGGEAEPVNFNVHKSYQGYEWIECKGCGLMAELKVGLKDELIAAWNRRAPARGAGAAEVVR
jgi:Lar family restriction alleviation protein